MLRLQFFGERGMIKPMDQRENWRKEKRRETEWRLTNLFAPTYDQDWGTSVSRTHTSFMDKFLKNLPNQGCILDAACGTGRFWPLIFPKGFSILGIDQSQGMLDRAKAKFPSVPVEKVGMQEMRFHEEFDGIICMDAMEYVFPEDWPVVLRNFNSALKPEGFLYLTVEIGDTKEIAQSYHKGLALGLPVVYGECGAEPGYHYYPETDKVKEWCREAGFEILEQSEGDEYYHFLARKRKSL